jgi:excisionase family DNA binding protein
MGKEITEPKPRLEYSSVWELVSKCGGGFIPPDNFSTAIWAELLGVDSDTVGRWVKKYRIPHMKPGAFLLIKASHMERFIPLINSHGEEETEAETPEGGREPDEN